MAVFRPELYRAHLEEIAELKKRRISLSLSLESGKKKDRLADSTIAAREAEIHALDERIRELDMAVTLTLEQFRMIGFEIPSDAELHDAAGVERRRSRKFYP